MCEKEKQRKTERIKTFRLNEKFYFVKKFKEDT